MLFEQEKDVCNDSCCRAAWGGVGGILCRYVYHVNLFFFFFMMEGERFYRHMFNMSVSWFHDGGHVFFVIMM